MTHLLVITNDFGPRQGGIESFVHALLERMPHASFTVFTSRQDGADAFDREFTRRTGARVVRDRAKVLLPSPRVARAAATLAVDVAATSVWFGAAAPLGLLAPRLRRAGVGTIVATTHGHEVWWSRVPLMRSAIRRIGSSVDVLTYLGEFTRSAIAPALRPADRSKLRRLAPGVDLRHFHDRGGAEVRERLGLGDRPVIACISRLVHRKGQDRLIAAMPRILEGRPDAHLLLVGRGPRRSALEALVRDHRVAHAVTFTGAVPYDELPAHYSAATLFAMPTRSRLAGLEVEGLGMVYLEASACRRAVIAGRSGGSPDAVLDGVTGVLVEDGIDEIADAILALLADDDRRERMGAEGRAWVERDWDWSQVADRFREFVLS